MAKFHIRLLVGTFALLALISCQAGDGGGDTSRVAQQPGDVGSRIERLDDQSIEVPGAGWVQLHGGAGEFQVAPGSPKGRVTLIEDGQRVWRSPKRTDLIAAMAIDSGGSGTFYYVAVYSLKAGTVHLEDSALLGDRIRITGVGIGELVHDPEADYRITIKMLERGEGAPLADEPTLPSARVFYVTGGKLDKASTCCLQ